MNWSQAEAALRTYIEIQWALGSYANIPLVWENENEPESDMYMAINIEGIFAEKGRYGSVGKHSSLEAGIIFFHNFVPKGSGKQVAILPVVSMMEILELKTIETYIDLEGANPPSPVDLGDDLLDNQQPSGNYYRCSGSVPFIIRGSK